MCPQNSNDFRVLFNSHLTRIIELNAEIHAIKDIFFFAKKQYKSEVIDFETYYEVHISFWILNFIYFFKKTV